MTNLYSLTADAQSRLYQLSQLMEEGEIEKSVLADTIESIQGEVQDKQLTVAAHIKNLESDIDALTAHVNTITARIARKTKEVDALYAYLTDSMKRLQISRIDHSQFTLSFRQLPPKVVIEDVESIPREYLREVPARFEPDKAKLKLVLKNGKVPGAKLQAGEKLVITT